jgi:hypothetical protein
MKGDARDVPLDKFEVEMLQRLLRAQSERPRESLQGRLQPAAPDRLRRRRRPRIGLRWRGRALGVALIALFAASGALAAVSILGGSSAPVRLYGGQDLCPVNYGYAAQASTRLFYPPNYPGRQFSEGQDLRCFASAKYARDAGYTPAPAPVGDARVGPIYLAPTPAPVRHTCAAAQRETRATIYCPGLLPTPWVHPAINWDCPTAECHAPLLSLTGSFSAPSSYIGSAPGVGEATIWSATARQQRTFPYLVGCLAAKPRLVGHTSFHGHPAAWYRCSIFGSSTSTMLEWHIGKQSYGITADGPASIRRELVDYISAHLVARSSGRHG